MDSERFFAFERLGRSHIKSEFDCGEPGLNDFLRRYAGQNARSGLSATFVAVDAGQKQVLGFYSLSSGQVACETIPEAARAKLPRYPIPVIRLARLATDLSVRGLGLGKLILVDALKRVRRLSDEIGIYAVEVDALTPEARDFYLKFGFVPLIDDDLHLYLPIKTIKKLFEQ